MKNKKLLLAIAVLVTVTAVLAVIHLNNSPEVNAGDLLILQGSNESCVTIRPQQLVPVTGTLVNGKDWRWLMYWSWPVLKRFPMSLSRHGMNTAQK